ncbi:pleckstrin homology domain-containing family G member 4B isoform X1 [Scleropages formosus]|uniref:Pleckstrin homology and RhoGEF domain containing G4B n=2 Tax=Scleropages formosus TaxID=113540 RepID=A0A8C9QRY7_SCLFO|nr:pleckstrin homology domain-containing family G member 4B isoform X1 [Scleropages formosus]
MHPRAKSQSCENYLSIKDSKSLDSCIQSTLSSLYPPFSATAATVLWQLFSVVERQYRGDGLRCLVDFLLPAKRVLQTIQQETSLRFKGLLFYHEGWPLCIHEKVVLQLAPLHKVRLRQGDFYLQVVPLGRKAVKLVIKCLSPSGQAIVEIPVAESMYGSIFAADFLQNVTRDRNLHPLQNCLLSTGAVVYRTPWKNVVNPLLVSSTTDAVMQARRGGSFRAHLSTCSTSGSTGTLDSHRSSRESLHSQGAESTVSEPGPPRGLMGTALPPRPREHQPHNPERKAVTTKPGLSPLATVGKAQDGESGGPRSLSIGTDLSNPGPRRRHPRDSAAFETRRLFRKSYMEALQNPMNLGSSSESILEEGSEQSSPPTPKEDSVSLTSGASDTRSPRRTTPKGWLGGEEPQSHSSILSIQRGLKTPELSRSERRAKSLERTNKASQVKGHRARSSSGGSDSSPLKKSMNGYALKFRKLDLETAFQAAERRSFIKDDSGLHGSGSDTERRRNSHSGEVPQSPKPTSATPKQQFGIPPAPPTDCVLPRLVSEVNQELLLSGAVILPGNRDRSGRAVLQVCTRNSVWSSESFTAKDLTCLFGYYYTTLRKEKRDQGIIMLMDTRRQQPSQLLLASLSELQAFLPNALYSVLWLVDKDNASRPDLRDFTVQCELLTSLKALQKHVDASHLTRDLEGSFAYDHNHWVQFRRKIEPFASSCRSAVSSLQSSIATLSSGGKLHTAKDVEEVIDQQKRLMKSVLDDTHLIQLRLEGGTVLARIRKEEACENDGYRDAVDLVSVLYNQVDEEVHKLVILSNKSLKRLENLLETRRFEEGSAQIKLWFSVEGEKYLISLDSMNMSLRNLKQLKLKMGSFFNEAAQHQKRGLQLIRESKMIPSATLSDFKQYLSSVLARTERRKAELDLLLNLYEFYDSADQWMEHCQDYLQSLSTDNSNSPFTPAVVQVLQDYHHEATKFSPENFSSLNEMVLNLSSARELKQWNDLWHKCQETREELEEALARAQVALEAPEPVEARVPSKGSSCLLSDITPPDPRAGLSLDSEDARTRTPSPFCRGPPAFPIAPPPGSPKSEGPSRRPSLFDDTDSDCTIDSFASCQSEPAFSPATRHRKQPLKKIMKKTMSYELSTREAGHTEVSLHGYTGVYIKGLEVANNVCVEKKYQRPDIKSPGLGRSRSMSSPAGVNCRHMEEDKKQSNKVQHIMDEMIATEREYVRSLTYIIENYFPEMERADLPQDLRGKRSIIFGNLEKLCDFHGQYFLKELERCAHAPLSVSSCFLHYEDQFGMYALYSKNKPQSDALLTSHGNGFFKNKQVELGDKMDLASYLLKPIQRMSKYALLLKDLIKECSHSQEQELSDLRTAEEMVKFQLRHGNDLLAMDAIRGCDVNLKEQGQLRCQDEFVVWCGRRKYLRHVFLFEDLILFSKTKKIDGGYDIYIYKQSYKTAEIGMTENVGDSGLRFEIWFRRRKSQDTFILQASSVEVKAAWTSIIGKILWRQALRNRELRMQEMVSMGIGNKPFMDIKPSEAAISDRAIDYTMKGSAESKSMASITASSFDHSAPFKRPHSTISNSSTSSSSSHSSSSLLGSLNLHLYPSPAHSLPGGASFGHWPYDCIEEDELEQDSGRQPSMITESSETSSQCTSSDSVGGLNGLTLPPSAAIAMDTFSSDVASPLHSSPFSSSSSPPSPAPPPVLFQKDQDLQSQGSSFITASKTSHITIGLSTVV